MYTLAVSRRVSSNLYRINDFLYENFITCTANISLSLYASHISLSAIFHYTVSSFTHAFLLCQNMS